MKKHIILTSILFLSLVIHGQEKSMIVSLEEAVIFALENNYNIKESKNSVLSAKETVWETTQASRFYDFDSLTRF